MIENADRLIYFLLSAIGVILFMRIVSTIFFKKAVSFKPGMMYLWVMLLALNITSIPMAQTQELEAVQVYSQDELIRLINSNQHLTRIKSDRCQIVEDIEARADIMQIPAFQFLWGDMLAWGVCIEKNPSQGVYYMREAANQGLVAALEQLGRYHLNGQFVQQDKERAVMYLREAAAMGNLKAQLQLADLFLNGYGSPYDYEDLYHWLYNAISDDKAMHKRISTYLTSLERLMHPKAVRQARRPSAQ